MAAARPRAVEIGGARSEEKEGAGRPRINFL
jgi:hypothetical protein